MKKGIWSFIMLTGMIFYMSLSVYGADIESVLTAVKGKIIIPAEYTVFESSSQVTANQNEWRFWWRTPGDNSKKAADEISVTADDKGNIKRYYHFKDEFITNDTNAHFSNYDKSDAKIFALRFVTKVCPELMDKIEFNQQALTANITKDLKTANVSFYRVENKIPYYSNYMNFVIDLSTSEIIQYECVWDYDLVFPAPDQVITPQAARRAYEAKVGIDLRYRLKVDGENKQAYLIYAPVDEQKMVDAVSGNIIRGTINNAETPVVGYSQASSSSNTALSDAKFTEQEILELHSIEKVMTISQAEQYIRSITELPISDEYILKSSNFTKRDSRYLIYLEFVKVPKKPSDQMTDKERMMLAAGDFSYIRATVDAVNMDVVALYQYHKETDKLATLVQQDAARQQVDDFLLKYLKNKYVNCKFKEMQKLDGGNTYQFSYICMLGNVPFEGNGITVNYDATTGDILSVVCDWQFNINVESAKDIIPYSQSKELIFKNAPMQLTYVNKVNYNVENYMSGEKPEIVLVYTLNPFVPKNILGRTGEVVDKSGKSFKIRAYQKFMDIEGHYAQVQIQRLSNNMIIDESGYFYPDFSITQADYLNMLYSGIKGSQFDNTDDLYNQAIRDKTIAMEEKNPAAEITREDAVVYFVRIMGLESVAQLKDIFALNYDDISSISEEKIGYIALAKGFGIIGNNESFDPKAALTRADAAVMVYNYLNR